MIIYFPDLPGWHFTAREVSAGWYQIAGLSGGEERVARTGADTTALLEDLHREALALVNAAREAKRSR